MLGSSSDNLVVSQAMSDIALDRVKKIGMAAMLSQVTPHVSCG